MKDDLRSNPIAPHTLMPEDNTSVSVCNIEQIGLFPSAPLFMHLVVIAEIDTTPLSSS